MKLTEMKSMLVKTLFWAAGWLAFAVTAVAASALPASVTLAWDANSETNVAGYIVYYGTTSSNYTCTTNVGNQTTATLSGLSVGTIYYFSATAYDQDGLESDFAPEINYTINSTITTGWPTPADIVYGTALGLAQLNASAAVAGTFTYQPAAGTVLSAGCNQVLSAIFTPADSNTYASVTNTVAITVLPAPLTITANSQSKAYGAALPALTVIYSGFVNGDTTASLSAQPTATTTATASSAVGSYPITASGAVASNYTVSYVAGTLTVNRASLTITANNQSKAYGATLPALTASYSGWVNGNNTNSLSKQAVMSTTAKKTSPVGSYPITASGAASANYSITYVPGTLTVTTAISSKSSRSAAQNLWVENLGNGSLRLSFAGIPGVAYMIEYTDNLGHPNWQTLGATTADENGFNQYVDTPAPGQGLRFYRSAYLAQ